MSSNDIFEAAASGDLEFLKKNTPLINQKNERNWTPLHFAARYGQLEVAKFLKEEGVDITAVNSENKTAAQVAKVWGNESVAKLLDVQEPVKESPFPENQVAVFAGSPLNRFGWKRNDHTFLASKARARNSKYLVLNGLQAIYNTEGSLQYLSYSDVASAVDRVYLQDSAVPNNSDTTLVFLGMDERQKEESVAYWALDITPKGTYEQEYTKLIQELESRGFEFCRTLPRAFSMDKEASSILAQAAAMVDWNTRNAYCSGCGKRTVSVEAGYKRHCVPDNAAQECISHKGVQNITYPRTGSCEKENKT
ncbi:hypothetical protein EDC96DRAFT_452768 [Choanephora cucurbitarum]|nr:hypothetical protein EDC96DRAFT_452768 [Choanephora cucurbitarum]